MKRSLCFAVLILFAGISLAGCACHGEQVPWWWFQCGQAKQETPPPAQPAAVVQPPPPPAPAPAPAPKPAAPLKQDRN